MRCWQCPELIAGCCSDDAPRRCELCRLACRPCAEMRPSPPSTRKQERTSSQLWLRAPVPGARKLRRQRIAGGTVEKYMSSDQLNSECCCGVYVSACLKKTHDAAI